MDALEGGDRTTHSNWVRRGGTGVLKALHLEWCSADHWDGVVQDRLDVCVCRSEGGAVAPASGGAWPGHLQRGAVDRFSLVAAPINTQPCPGQELTSNNKCGGDSA